MSVSEVTRPYRGDNFELQVNNTSVGRIKSIQLPSRTIQDAETSYDDDPVTKTTSAGVSYGDLVVERVVDSDTTLWDMVKALMDGDEEKGRADVAVVLKDEQGNELKRYNVINAFVKDYSVTQLDAESDEDVTEEFTFSLEEMNVDG